MLTPQAFKTEVVWSTFCPQAVKLPVLVIPLSVLRDIRESQHISVEQLFIWDTSFSSQDRLLGAPTHENSSLLNANKVFLCKAKKIVCCAWNYLLFRSVRISARADILQVVQGVLVVLNTSWVSCEKPPSNSGVLKSFPVPQPRQAFLMERMWVPLSTWEVWFLRWKLVCWVCYECFTFM